MLLLLLGLLFAQFRFTLSASSVQTIASADAYPLQRKCVKSCYWSQGCDLVGNILGCDSGCYGTAALDSCWCRPDLQSSAESYISSCVKSMCSTVGGEVSLDISTAVSLYGGYCTGKGYSAMVEAVTTPATTATKTSNNIETPAATVSSTAKSDPTVSTKNSIPTVTGAASGQGQSNSRNGTAVQTTAISTEVVRGGASGGTSPAMLTATCMYWLGAVWALFLL